jgi:hypothetical protein
MVIKNILPIGTIVELHDLDVKILIGGYCAKSATRSNYVWDYSGFMFPLGYSGADSIISFDSEQIKNVVAYGYQDQEQLEYAEKLEQLISTIDKGAEEA